MSQRMITVGLMLAAMSCSGSDDTSKLEKVLDVPLRTRPGLRTAYGDLGDGDTRGAFFGLVRFDSDDAGFVALCRDLGTDNRTGYLPTSWRWPLETPQPGWWTAAPSTPAMACARSYGVHGWIAAKLEEPHVFLIVTEMRGDR